MVLLRNELELKLSCLALPMDICVQHSVRGNSALQGALKAALSVLGELEACEDLLRNEDILKVPAGHTSHSKDAQLSQIRVMAGQTASATQSRQGLEPNNN